jgi:hypothetical protein
MAKISFVHPMGASLRERATCEDVLHEWRHGLFCEKGDEAASLGIHESATLKVKVAFELGYHPEMVLNLLVLLFAVRLEVLSFINQCRFLALLPLDLLSIIGLFVCIIALLPLSTHALR